jgi:uncharacterized membrane protein
VSLVVATVRCQKRQVRRRRLDHRTFTIRPTTTHPMQTSMMKHDTSGRSKATAATKGAGDGRVRWFKNPFLCYRFWNAVVFIVAVCPASLEAAKQVGYLFGWIVGASKSPIAPAVAPLVFGLLALIGAHAALSRTAKRRSSLYQTAFAAVIVSVFCFWCYRGIQWGGFARIPPYKTLRAMLGTDNETLSLDPEISAELYAFQLRARAAGVSFEDFEPFVLGVIKPIVHDDEPNKLERLQRVISTMDSAIPNVDELSEPNEPSGETAKEPAGEPDRAE